MTVFGRDALVAAYETLPFHQEFARATLEALAEMQASEWDNWRDAEPGKILHELRRGTLAALGRIPHTPYYGAHDSTPLFLIVLDEYERWSDDADFVRRLEPNARAALSWLEGPADLDGDGYIGHLLWCGIVDDGRAEATVRSLLSDGLFSGWGIRSLSSEMAGYHPLGYHAGTVWPHDTAIVAEGMRRYGFRDEAARLREALFAAAAAFENRLPEVFAGFARDGAGMPVEYPDALKPQSWAAGAPLLALRTLLGLDVVDGRVRFSACLPDSIARLHLRRLGLRGRYVDV